MSTETQIEEIENPVTALKHAAGTDIGMRREENQDSFGIIENDKFKFYVVCDGMGGVKGGGIASNLAVGVIRDCFQSRQSISEIDIVGAVQQANTAIFEKGTGDAALAGMGTTFVGLAFTGTQLFISSVGDSRAYLVRENNITQLTTDHTLVQELLRSGAINPEQADNHPVSHMLTRSLGPAPTVDVDCWLCADGPARGDIYIMCSDGLYNLVSDAEVAQIVQDNYIDNAIQKLIDLANSRGGNDNITIVVIEIGETFPFGPENFESLPHAPDFGQAAAVAAPTNAAQEIPADAVASSEEEVPDTGGLNTTPAADQPGSSPTYQNGQVSSVAETEAIEAEQQKIIPDEVRVAQAETLTTGAEATASGQAAIKSEQDLPEADTSEDTLAAVRLLSRRLRFPVGITLVLLAGVIGGIYLGPQFSGSPAGSGISVVAPVVPVAQVAKVNVEVNRVDAGHSARLPLAPMLPHDIESSMTSDMLAVDSLHLSTGHETGLSREEIERIARRKQSLQSVLIILREKIASFDRPLSGKTADALKDARTQVEQLESALEGVRGNIDIATRKLSVWYGRRKRLQTTDPVNLGTEVAVTSTAVKDKKEMFERATWAYLREAENLRYNPSDQTQAQKVSELAAARKERMRELSEEVRRAIEREVAESDKVISELTLKRDRMEAEIESLRRNVEYFKVLLSGDSRAKDLKKQELVRESVVALRELDELKHLLPDPVSAGAAGRHSDPVQVE